MQASSCQRCDWALSIPRSDRVAACNSLLLRLRSFRSALVLHLRVNGPVRQPGLQVFVGGSGQFEALAESIRSEGLLQPIGITEENELVFGARRLAAVRDNLGWTEIDTRVVNVSSIVAGEFAENVIRKQFTVSERVAIVEALRSFKRPGRPKKNRSDPTNTSTAGAVKQAGFGGKTTYQCAARVVSSGSPELVQAVDNGDITIDAAAEIATLPKDKQSRALAIEPAARKALVSALEGRPS